MAQKNFLQVLEENYEASKHLVDEDKIRPAQDLILETYRDLISIYKRSFLPSENEMPLKLDIAKHFMAARINGFTHAGFPYDKKLVAVIALEDAEALITAYNNL
jgi:hypothetical protein